MFMPISVSLGSTLAGSPICGFLMYTSFILVSASLVKEDGQVNLQGLSVEKKDECLDFFASILLNDTSGPFLSECPYSARLTCPAASSSSAPAAGG